MNLCPVGINGTSQIVQRTSSILLIAASAMALNHKGILKSPYIKSLLETHEAEFKIIIDQGNIHHSYFKVLYST